MRKTSAYACLEISREHSLESCRRTHHALRYHPKEAAIAAEHVVDGITEEDAYRIFLMLRWPDTAGRPVCPKCGRNDPYAIRRRAFRCSWPGCRKEFTATTETAFASRKISFVRIVAAFNEQATLNGRVIARQLGLKLGVSYKTAHGLRKKIGAAAVEGIDANARG